LYKLLFIGIRFKFFSIHYGPFTNQELYSRTVYGIVYHIIGTLKKNPIIYTINNKYVLFTYMVKVLIYSIVINAYDNVNNHVYHLLYI